MIMTLYLITACRYRTALSRIAVQHADDGYSRRGNLGSLLCSQYMFNHHSPDDISTHIILYGSTGEEFEGIESVYGVKSCKIVVLRATGGKITIYMFRHFCCRYRLVTGYT